MKQRIIGIDVARALAVFGMIIVNFKIVFGSSDGGWLSIIANAFDGKAAATFVVLAGVGIALMSNSAIRDGNAEKLKSIRTSIIKRAVFLFIIGLSYIIIWPADILHFYGVYMLFTLLFLTAHSRVILGTAIALILLYPFLLGAFDYESGWNFETLEYLDFWTFEGFFRNLFYNGFHPVIPWVSFMMVGLWFGKKDLHNEAFVKKSMLISGSLFILTQAISLALIGVLAEGSPEAWKELQQVLGTDPMPPLPIYMISGSSIAIFTISAGILVSNWLSENVVITALYKTGQLALTFYVAHVIIGMGAIEIFSPENLGGATLAFSFSYALIFSFLCICFAIIWRTKFTSGPLEWLMRKLVS